ncbi:hypothetical protein FHN55_01050 [Streptomyces sp. NP160]|uniref:hypothetical protein n=1 Tax=Streptomyces sp. NP160 TaxID=2586637 RepID=UPI0011196B93|nr:hypothetical protein [Streptomyces sp. NP160]TNM70299.1 hypothetical protein FHN55_01050 [Streptomyces sp. NP160]
MRAAASPALVAAALACTATACTVLGAALGSCSVPPPPAPAPSASPAPTPAPATTGATSTGTATTIEGASSSPSRPPSPAPSADRTAGGRAGGQRYPLHTGIVATTFWVGEVFDPDAPDGSQVLSAYDDHWLASYGGCDGVVVDGTCTTERRTAANGYFPTAMTPRQNPFYLDLPFDDVNDPSAAAQRAAVVPWAHEPRYAAALADPGRSLMKDRWVAVRKDGRTCYGQVEDAGPGVYDDARYVFGADDARPANRRYNGAGMDVSPALNGCLGFSELDGEDDVVDWWFVDDADVPAGPWTRLVTRG